MWVLYKIDYTEAVRPTTAAVLYRAEPWRPNYKASNSITAVLYAAATAWISRAVGHPGVSTHKSIDLKGSESTASSIIIIRSA